MNTQRNPLRRIVAGVLVSAVAIATLSPSAFAGTTAGKKVRYLPEVSPEIEAQILNQLEAPEPAPAEIIILNSNGEVLYQETLATDKVPSAEASKWMNRCDFLFQEQTTKYYSLSE